MKFLLITLGSHGDVHPFLSLGRALKERGHTAAVLTNPYFERQTVGEGLVPLALTEHADLKELLVGSKAMDPHAGPIVVLRQMTLPMVPTMIEATRRAIREFKPDAAVVHPICMGTPWVCRQEGVPFAAACLSPCMWFNPHDTIVMPSFRREDPSPRLVRFDLALGRVFTGLVLDRPLNRIRRGMGLPKVKNILQADAVGGDINLGLWSSHFRGPLPGDPVNGTICGFPWHDRHKENEDDLAAIDRFMADGPPPVVFCLGTAAVHTAGTFYRDAAEACRILKCRGMLLVGGSDYHPHPAGLPEGVRAFTYAPFSRVFPRAAAIVHHGGVGSTGQALRSGRPTVICPLSHDQPDNAARASRLGVSLTVKHSKAGPKPLAAALRRVLEEPDFSRRAADLGSRVASEDGAGVAAEAVVRLASGQVRPSSEAVLSASQAP